MTRRAAHDWAAVWVEHRWQEVDRVVQSGLQHIHGFDLTHDRDTPNLVRHGSGDVYVHSVDAIVAALVRWEELCASHPDPTP